MDGWTEDGRMDGWTDRRTDERTDRRTNGWLVDLLIHTQISQSI